MGSIAVIVGLSVSATGTVVFGPKKLIPPELDAGDLTRNSRECLVYALDQPTLAAESSLD
jgi:hypothetical protein